MSAHRLPPDPEAALDAELAFHIEQTIEELVGSGMTRQEATDEALRRFGDTGRYRAQLLRIDRARVRRDRLFGTVAIVVRAVRHSARALLKAPAFALGVALTLGLGIGANATMFGVVDRLLLSPPDHIDEADEVRRLYVRRMSFNGSEFIGTTFTYPDYQDFQRASSFAEVGGYSSGREVTIGAGLEAKRATTTLASASFFSLLGVRPALGRFFATSEDRIGAEGTAVLGHGFWRQEYGSDPSIIGQVLTIRGRPFTVVGIAPEGFTGTQLTKVDLWLPLTVGQSLLNGEGWQDNRRWWWLRVVGRLADGATTTVANAETTAQHRAAREEFIAAGQYDPEVRVEAHSVIAARGPRASSEARIATWLAGVAGIVLLIACANVTNLLLVRGVRRQRELAVRLALGSSRRRLFLERMVETGLLVLVGVGVALVLAGLGGNVIRRVLLPEVAWSGWAVDPRMAGFAVVIAGVAALLAGTVPALQSTASNLAENMRLGERGATQKGSRLWWMLLTAQTALTVVLLAGAGLFVRSLNEVQAVDLGFQPEGVHQVRIQPKPGEYDAAQALDLYQRTTEAVERLPGVLAAGIVTVAPFQGSISTALRAEGVDSLETPPSGGPYFVGVTAGVFPALGLRLDRGRLLTDEDDRPGSQPVAVITRGMAEGVWPDEEALGRCLYFGPDAHDTCTTVVGVISDVNRQSVVESAQWLYYLPIHQTLTQTAPGAVLLKERAPESVSSVAVQRAVLTSVPELDYAAVQSLQDIIDPEFRSWRLGAMMFSLFGLLALAVASVGLYSVLTFTVSLRRRELGIRSALGASRATLVGMVLRQALWVAGVGMALGLAAAASAGRFVQPLLFGVSPSDPRVLMSVCLTLALVALVAAYVPARRAAKADPTEALKLG